VAKPRVFISHSTTRDPETAKLREELSALLHGEFDVRVDKEDLEPGEMWRSRINSWLGGCHAAVALLSPTALKSSYVAYELSVLTFRKDVLVIPVFLSGVGDAEVRQSPLAPTVIQERQAIVEPPIEQDKEGLDRSQLAARIRDALVAKKATLVGVAPIDLQAERLAQRLRRLSDKMVAHYMDELDPGEESNRIWEGEGGDAYVTLAHMLMSAGIEGAQHIFLDLIEDLDLETVQNVFERISTSWVDLRAAEYIKNVARGAPAGRVLAMNGVQKLIAELYVLRASGRSIDNNWKIVDSHGFMSDRAFDGLKADIELALGVELNVAPEALPAKLKSLDRKGQPVFVRLPAAGVNGEVLKDLRGAFPTVTFFFMAGRDLDHRRSLTTVNVNFIIPELEDNFEESFCELYEDVRCDLYPEAQP
jgi:hypothetical protein